MAEHAHFLKEYVLFLFASLMTILWTSTRVDAMGKERD